MVRATSFAAIAAFFLGFAWCARADAAAAGSAGSPATAPAKKGAKGPKKAGAKGEAKGPAARAGKGAAAGADRPSGEDDGKAVSKSDRAKAKAHYDRGHSLFVLDKYDEAIAEYEKSYELLPHPAMLYNIAQAYRLAGKYERAIHFYEFYVREAVSTPKRKMVLKIVAGLRAKLEAEAAAKAPPKEPAEPKGPAGGGPAKPESLAVVGPGPGAVPGAGLLLAPAPPAGATPAPEVPGGERPKRRRWLPWVIVGASLAAGGAALAAGLLLAPPRLEYPETSLPWLDAR